MTKMADEYGALNLSQGFPDFSTAGPLIDLVHDYMRRGYNQYAPMPGVPALRQAIAEKVEALYHYAPDPEREITVTAGASQAIFTAIAAFVHHGDEVVLIEPAFDAYRPAVELAGGKVVAFELAAPDYRVDWAALGKLIGPATRLLIINTPHNPTGTALNHSDMQVLENLLSIHPRLMLLSDEVYEHLTFDGLEHASVLRYPALRERSIVTYSFGKTFHNTGWKIGYCIMPSDWMTEFRKVHQYNVFAVNTPMQHALAEYLATPEHYLQLGEFYEKKRDLFLNAASGSALRPLRCEGTYFQLFSYAAAGDLSDMDFAKHLTQHHGVAAIPISAFYTSGRDEHIIRLCFAKRDATLAEAGKRLQNIGKDA